MLRPANNGVSRYPRSKNFLSWQKISSKSSSFCWNCNYQNWSKTSIISSEIIWEGQSKVLYFTENRCKFCQDTRKVRIICRSTYAQRNAASLLIARQLFTTWFWSSSDAGTSSVLEICEKIVYLLFNTALIHEYPALYSFYIKIFSGTCTMPARSKIVQHL